MWTAENRSNYEQRRRQVIIRYNRRRLGGQWQHHRCLCGQRWHRRSRARQLHERPGQQVHRLGDFVRMRELIGTKAFHALHDNRFDQGGIHITVAEAKESALVRRPRRAGRQIQRGSNDVIHIIKLHDWPCR